MPGVTFTQKSRRMLGASSCSSCVDIVDIVDTVDTYCRYCTYLGVAGGGDILQIDGPQLGEDEGVEEGAHVHHGGLALLREPRQDNLSSEVR